MTNDEKIFKHLDKIDEHLCNIDVTLAKQNVTLESHVKRTDTLEDKLIPEYNWSIVMKNQIKNVLTFLTLLGGTIGIIYTIGRMTGYL